MNGTRTTTEVIGLNGTTVRDAMHEGVLSCPTCTPLSTGAELMADGFVPRPSWITGIVALN